MAPVIKKHATGRKKAIAWLDWKKRRERKTRSIRKADLVVCRNGGPPVTSGGIGVAERRSSGSPSSVQTPSFPSESSFITLTWETQRGFFHPRALMFSLSETSRGCFSFFLVISSSLGLSLPLASLLSSPFFPGYAFLSLLRGSSRTIRPISSERF